MKNSTYLERIKILIFKGVKISAIPALLINAFIAILISLFLNAIEPSWDFTFTYGLFHVLIDFSIFTIVVFLGIVLISLVLAYLNRGLTNITAGFGGAIIGIVCAITANMVLLIIFYFPGGYFFEYMFDFLFGQVIPIYSLSSLATICILAYISLSLNKTKALLPANGIADDLIDKTSIELHVARMVTQVIGIGCVFVAVYHIIYEYLFEDTLGAYYHPYDIIVISVIELGFVLLITLPIVFAGGFLSGSIVKRIRNKGLLSHRLSLPLGILTSVFVFAGVMVAKSIIFGHSILYPPFSDYFIVDLVFLVVASGVIGKRLYGKPPDNVYS